jgi:hypothetical protein
VIERVIQGPRYGFVWLQLFRGAPLVPCAVLPCCAVAGIVRCLT